MTAATKPYRYAVLAVTDKGRRLGEQITAAIDGCRLIDRGRGVGSAFAEAWNEADGLICVMAAGIVVRLLVGRCRSKFVDPAVVVVDENGRFAISLLSGHIGGANQLARKVADVCGGTAVITTASDVSGHTALDLWALANSCVIVNPERLARVSAKLANTGRLTLYQERPDLVDVPPDIHVIGERDQADLVVSYQAEPTTISLHLMPRRRFIGLGCRQGVALQAFTEALQDLQQDYGLDLRSVAGLASIDLKKQEQGLREIAERYRWPLRFFSSDELNRIATPTPSTVVYQKTGAHSVCEAAAMRAAGTPEIPGKLIISKVKWKTITAAVAEPADSPWSAPVPDRLNM